MNAIETTPAVDSDNRATLLARESLYRFLAAALSDPRNPIFRLVLTAENQTVAAQAADLLRKRALRERVPLGFGELPAEELDLIRLIGELRRPLSDLTAEYDRVFGLVFTRDCPPHETDYCANEEPFFRAQQMADVAGFYRAFGLDVAHDRPERPDHIALEFEFMGFLLAKERLAADGNATYDGEQATICRTAQHSFLADHLAWWVPSYATGLRRKAGDGPYAALARILAALMPIERSAHGVKAPQLPVRPTTIERPEEADGCVGCSTGA
jgi:putative dimethyl sulfoxide reductase chaperone